MRAISSMATRHLLVELLAAAAAAGLPPVELESVGGVAAATRVAGGEPFDLVVLAADALKRLGADGHIDPLSRRALVRSQVAVGVPADAHDVARRADRSAFPDAGGLRAALQSARRIGYSTGPSGTALLRLIRSWGLSDELGPRLVQARPGVPVARLLADGEADLGLQQLSELVGQPGVRVLGVLPSECAIETVFSGAVATASADPAAAAAVLSFLCSTEAAPIKAAHSFSSA